MICTSYSWPNMFDVARGKVSLYQDAKSITNRVKLLLLTDPTELHMNPTFGVGLRKYMFRYNNDNAVAMIKENLIEQLRMWEPSVIAEETQVTRTDVDSGNYSDYSTAVAEKNHLKLTVVLKTNYGETVTVEVAQTDLGESFIGA